MITQTKMQGLSSREAEFISTISGSGLRVFTIADAARLLGLTHPVVSIIAHRLTEKKKLQRIEKSKYILIPPEAWKTGKYTEEGILLASQLINPCALAYWTALSFHGWTEQVSRTIFVQTTKQKGPLDMQGMTVRFVKLRPSRFFGHEEHWIGSQKVIVTDKEKTIADCLDQPRYCGEIVEAAKGLWNGREVIEPRRLIDYALRMGNGAILKRLGFLAGVLGVFDDRFRRQLKKHIKPAFVALDPGQNKDTGPYNTDWYVRVNINPKSLTEWMTH